MIKHSLATLAILLGLMQFAQAQQKTPEIKMTDLGSGVYAVEGAGGHIGVLVGDNGTFIIDAQYQATATKLLTSLQDITQNDRKLLLNTHWHGDHTGGYEVLAKAGASKPLPPIARPALLLGIVNDPSFNMTWFSAYNSKLMATIAL